jgi:phospholipid transport system substrate-binding protein
MIKQGCAAVLLAAVVLSVSPVYSASTPGAASTFVRDLGKQAIRVLAMKETTLAEREVKLQDVLYANFDIATIGRFALGRYWRQASTGQRNDYLKLFGKFLVQTYSSKLGGYSGEDLEITSETLLKNKIDVLVNTKIERPSGPPLKIAWRIRSRDDVNRKIIDVMIEGTSMALSQREQFSSVVRNHGLQGLLETLRARTTKVKATQSGGAGASKP